MLFVGQHEGHLVDESQKFTFSRPGLPRMKIKQVNEKHYPA